MKTNLIVFGICIQLILLFDGCDNGKCSVSYSTYPSRRDAPFIFITGHKTKCVYDYSGEFWLDGANFTANGEMFFREEAIFLTIPPINSSKIKFSDFSKNVQEEYDIRIGPENSTLLKSETFRVKVERIIITDQNIRVSVFRINDAFVYEGVKSDLIFFVSRERGITGSYISDSTNGVDWVIAPRGDILRNLIDYSKMEFGRIL